MTDLELIRFLGIEDEPCREAMLARITPEQRELYVRMADVETEIKLWQAGLGPKPAGVLICTEHSHGSNVRHEARNIARRRADR